MTKAEMCEEITSHPEWDGTTSKKLQKRSLQEIEDIYCEMSNLEEIK